MYLDLIGAIPNVDRDDPVPVPPPTLDEGPHLSYAVQWFIFAAAVLLGWVLAVRRSIAAHRRAATPHVTARSRRASDAGFRPSVDAASTTTTT